MGAKPKRHAVPAGAKRTLHKKARRAARRAGMRAHTSNEPLGPDNYGGYVLVDAYIDATVIGHCFVLTAGEVIDYCSRFMS